MSTASTTAAPGRLALWTGVWGGAVAWFVHLAASYAIAEFGCVAGWDRFRLLGLGAVTWGILAATALTLAATAWAGWLAWRCYRATDGAEEQEASRGLAGIGLILNALFAFSILFETVPIFFLADC